MFVQDKDGHQIWKDTTEEDKNLLLDEIINQKNSAEPEVDLTEVNEKIQEITATFEKNTKKIKDTNNNYLKAMQKIQDPSDDNFVDIIIPVYGGLHLVKNCLASVQKHTKCRYQITIVDDASPDEKTIEWLREWQSQNLQHAVLFNKTNRGFAGAVNRGIKAGTGRYVCLLNSDIIVTDNWLTKMLVTLESDPAVSIVNPITNNTSVIDVPMRPGFSYLDMNHGLQEFAPEKEIEIVPVGYCFLFRRELFNTIGEFDEAYVSYGEETDFWARSQNTVDKKGIIQKNRALLTTNAYVFHEKMGSFNSLGASKSQAFRIFGANRFRTLWPGFSSWAKINSYVNDIHEVRNAPLCAIPEKDKKYNIAFLVFSAAYCGGMAFISDIVNELIEQGVNAKIVQIKRKAAHPAIPPMEQLRCSPVMFNDPEHALKEFSSQVFDSGIVVAATNEMQQIAFQLSKQNPKLKNLLFSQSFDPAFAANDKMKKVMLEQFHSAQNIITNAKWLDKEIEKITEKKTLGVVTPGVNTDLFYPRGRAKGDSRPTVLFFLNPNDQYRGFNRGVEVAQHLYKMANSNHKEIRLLGVGVSAIQGIPFINCVGKIPQTQLATLLGTEVDVICDPQLLHSYGMPSLEGMASGAVPVCWDNQGCNEFINNGTNGIVLPKEATPNMVATEIYDLLFKDKTRLGKLRNEAIKVTSTHDRSKGVQTFINTTEKYFGLSVEKKLITLITPHIQKTGGPKDIIKTAEILQDIGHEVLLCTINPQLHPELLNEVTVPVSINWKDPGECDLLIVNSDNAQSGYFNKVGWAKKRALLKMSHCDTFKSYENKTLKYKWDRIYTTTKWLKDVLNNPPEDPGWDFPPQEAQEIGWSHYDHQYFNCSIEEKPWFSGNRLNITTLVSSVKEKGTNEALKCLEQIKTKFGNNINIVGIGQNPELRGSCPPWVQFRLNQTRQELIDIFKQTDVFLSASESEGLGRLILEAMSSSCFVVTTPIKPDYLKDGKNCIISKGFKAEDLLEAFTRVDPNSEQFKKIAYNGNQTACLASDDSMLRLAWKKAIEDLFKHDS